MSKKRTNMQNHRQLDNASIRAPHGAFSIWEFLEVSTCRIINWPETPMLSMHVSEGKKQLKGCSG